MVDLWLKYGILGAIVLTLAGYIMYLHKQADKKDKYHREEREELRKISQEHFTRLNEISDETHKVLRENTGILSGLKSLLEIQNK